MFGMGTISHPASASLGSGAGHRSYYSHATACLHVTLELTTLELLAACQGKKVMIWSCVLQIVERGASIEEFPASVFTGPCHNTLTHTCVSMLL